MGLPLEMNNIHAPTVPSGSSTSTPTSNLDRLSFQQLQQKKDDIEAELQALGSVLDSVRPLDDCGHLGNTFLHDATSTASTWKPPSLRMMGFREQISM
jgi:hypothetical protein